MYYGDELTFSIHWYVRFGAYLHMCNGDELSYPSICLINTSFGLQVLILKSNVSIDLSEMMMFWFGAIMQWILQINATYMYFLAMFDSHNDTFIHMCNMCLSTPANETLICYWIIHVGWSPSPFTEAPIHSELVKISLGRIRIIFSRFDVCAIIYVYTWPGHNWYF